MKKVRIQDGKNETFLRCFFNLVLDQEVEPNPLDQWIQLNVLMNTVAGDAKAEFTKLKR